MLEDWDADPAQAEEVMRAYLQAADEREARRLLECLVRRFAAPVIREVLHADCHVPRDGEYVVAATFDQQEAEEIHPEVVAQLIAHLQKCRVDPRRGEIHDFNGYVAVMTQHACAQYLHRKYPRRRRLRHRLYYLLKTHERFALWPEDDGWLSGYAVWRSARQKRTLTRRWLQLRDDPGALAAVARKGESEPDAPPVALLEAIFDWVGTPVPFEALVGIVAEIRDIRDLPAGEGDGTLEALGERLPDAGPSVEKTVSDRALLEMLWCEVRELPPRQAAALLLNLRDGDGNGVLPLLAHVGIASERQIAALIGRSGAQLEALWDDLPLDDATIARCLGVTRQQVINLRKVARERLARRLKANGYE